MDVFNFILGLPLIAVHGLSLVVASGRDSLLQCLLWWFGGFSRRGAQAFVGPGYGHARALAHMAQ